jgi:hypothetical protein
MLTLLEFQSRVSAELLNPTMAASVPEKPESGLTPEALRVHRTTAQEVWTRALQLTFPALQRLIPAETFERLAHEYARAHLPQDASLDDYGAYFPEFLAAQPDTRTTRYLIDLAHFELALERTGRQPRDAYSRSIPLDPHTHLRLLGSVTITRFEFPVDLIRDAVDAARPMPLAGLDLTQRTRYLALWRGVAGATLKALSTAPAHFLEAILREDSAEHALELAVTAADIPPGEAIAAIQAELFTSTFLQIIHPQRTGT